LYQLSPEQNDSIEVGRKEIQSGSFVENSEVISEMREWLTKK
jgi:predicted transcriptional regulator